jgi:hypothetical protein
MTTSDTTHLRRFSVVICRDCLALKGDECTHPDCIFYSRSMAEVRQYLDVLLIRPMVDGNPLFTDQGEPA